MTVCSFFLEGRCRYGDKCWNEHPRGGRNQNPRGGGGSVNRVWVNPSHRPGGGMVQPSSFSHGGGDWGRGNSGSGRDDRSSNFSFNTQNRFSALGNTQSGYARTGGGGGGGGGGGEGGDDTHKQLEGIQRDMEVWQSSGQWLFSCYAILKASITGFVELSPEELRMEYYTCRATGDVQSYVNSVQQLANQWRSRVQELRTMSGHTRASMIAELNNPKAQTSSGGGIFSSSSAPSTEFGSAPPTGFGSTTPTGFGSAPSTGFGSAPATMFGSAPSTGLGSTTSTGFGSTPSTGIASAPAPLTGFGSAPPTGFGSTSPGFQGGGFGSSGQNSAAGFSFSASNPGFGSSGSQAASSQFGSSAPSASSFSFAHPAGATPSQTSTTGFSFASSSARGFSDSASGGGFGGGAGVAGSAEDGKSGGLFTPLSELTPDELQEFTAKRFTLGQIPLRPPPAELLNV